MAAESNKSSLRLNLFKRTAQTNCGFTLVELLIVLTITAILATMMIVGFTEFKGKAKVARCRSEIRSLEKEITAFATDMGKIPESLEPLGRQDLLDPWGSPYEYKDAANMIRITIGNTPINTDFDLYSKGPDGRSAPNIFHDDSMDDIIRSDNGAFCDMVSRYSL